MVRYPLEKWTRFALAAVAFTAALLLTPRALLDVSTEQAGSYEVPVDMLEPSDDCIWCSTVPEEFDDVDCGDPNQVWIDTDGAKVDDVPFECYDRSIEPSA